MPSSSTLAVMTLFLLLLLLSPSSIAIRPFPPFPQPLNNPFPPLPQLPHIAFPPLPQLPNIAFPPLPQPLNNLFPPLPPLPQLPHIALPPLPQLPNFAFPPLPNNPFPTLPPLPQFPNNPFPPFPQLPNPFENATFPGFFPAPPLHDSPDCPINSTTHQPVNIAMVLDFTTIRGTIASIFSLLNHTACPTHIFFHFAVNVTTTTHHHNHRLQRDADRNILQFIRVTLAIIFPGLHFDLTIIHTHKHTVNSPAMYLADMLHTVDKAIYIDPDVIILDDIVRLWNTTQLSNSKVIAAPENCNANFSSYFTRKFWRELEGSKVFEKRRGKPCYFDTGLMVVDMARWRKENYTEKMEKWTEMEKTEKIFSKEGSKLTPFLVVFGGEVEAIDDHRWNPVGLGEMITVDELKTGAISSVHWSGEKPWERLGKGKPLPVDQFWASYDLYDTHQH